jgi:hypothetical protein
MRSIVDWLQDWTKTQIDGDWEHEQGISIGMLDNPGWILRADISNYGDFLKASEPLGRDNDEDWIDFEIRIIAKTYVYIEIFGDINKLNQILHSFRAIIEELEEIEKKGIGILSSQRIKEIIDSVSKSLEAKTEQEEELRETYIRFVSKQKNEFFDEDLYNIFFEKLNERFKQWKKNGAVPMRAFEICIDCIYVLSKTAQKLSEKDLEKSKTVKDEMYGLLMGFE